MPAIEASRSTASGNDTPSVFMTKSKMFPFKPDEKSNQACFSSLTKKDGVFSCWNGDSPLNSRPAFFSLTRRPTTSEAGSRARSSSRNWGVKRISGCVPESGRLPTIRDIGMLAPKAMFIEILAAIHMRPASKAVLRYEIKKVDEVEYICIYNPQSKKVHR